MDILIYFILLAELVIIVTFIIVGMRHAYNTGRAIGKLEASIEHTELLMKQWGIAQIAELKRQKSEGE